MIRLDQIPEHKRAAHKARLLAELPIPAPFEVDGISIKIRELRFEGSTGALVVFLSAARGNEILIDPKEDHRIINPPIKAPAGIMASHYHPRFGSFEAEHHVEDLEAALRETVKHIVLTTLEHRRP